MYSFVARQPILDQHQRPVAYELLFREGLSNQFPDVSAEHATTCLIAEQFLSQRIQQLVGEHACYINFPYSLILSGLADSLPVDQAEKQRLSSGTGRFHPGSSLGVVSSLHRYHQIRFSVDQS